jgi:hypothetical protein
MCYLFKGILFSDKEVWNYAIFRKIDGSRNHHVMPVKPNSERQKMNKERKKSLYLPFFHSPPLTPSQMHQNEIKNKAAYLITLDLKIKVSTVFTTLEFRRFFVFFLLLCWCCIVTFIKVLTMYHSWIQKFIVIEISVHMQYVQLGPYGSCWVYNQREQCPLPYEDLLKNKFWIHKDPGCPQALLPEESWSDVVTVHQLWFQNQPNM